MKKENPAWEEVYNKQLKELIDRGFAREVSAEELANYKGPTYYVAHQMAPNPSSKTTPVRVVFNSSQVYKGHSFNQSVKKGPDMLNSLHGVLLRFREDVEAACGDVSKMYYMVLVAAEDQYMQLFVWQWPGEDVVRTYMMRVLIMCLVARFSLRPHSREFLGTS